MISIQLTNGTICHITKENTLYDVFRYFILVGFKFEYETPSGSRYFKKNGQRVRVSDHDLSCDDKIISINVNSQNLRSKLDFHKKPKKLDLKTKNGIKIL